MTQKTSSTRRRRELTVEDYVDGVRAGDRAMLARAITLVESANAGHQAMAVDVIQQVQGETGRAHRIGITGVPGVGKSTTIDQFASNLTGTGRRVAVLAVDPTSSRTGGSILGDKTRMSQLVRDPNAFIRPSPTAGSLGGVARKTRESMALCEAAGFDIVIVETVGVGQSEIAVSDMVDVFVVLALPGAGDELQGIKKGILEIADIIAVNKADGDNRRRAERAAGELRAALHILAGRGEGWQTPVLTVSGLENAGLDRLAETITAHRRQGESDGSFAGRRSRQNVSWMHDLLRERAIARVFADPERKALLRNLEPAVREGAITPAMAVRRIMECGDA